MKMENEIKNLTIIKRLLQEAGLVQSGRADLHITTLAGDGSSRKFWRIAHKKESLCLAVAPPSTHPGDLAEAAAARSIGLHLLKQGVRVPNQYGWDKKSGVLLFEDFGDCKLYDFVQERQIAGDFLTKIRPMYRQVVKHLAHMQVQGAVDFNQHWCWDTPCYDKKLMLERESGYFLRAFWQDLMGLEEPAGLQEEFMYLADQAALVSTGFFLHRDFQSRNIMIHRDEPCVIDFQGGRFGPLGYDLASLLIDPYVALPKEFQMELLEMYLEQLDESISVERTKFLEEYQILALHRNLQIIGAFSFLSKQRKKVFFSQFIKPAFTTLKHLVEDEFFADKQVLRKTVLTAVKEMS